MPEKEVSENDYGYLGVSIFSKDNSILCKDVKVIAGGTEITGIESISINMNPEPDGSYMVATIRVVVNHLDIKGMGEVNKVCHECHKSISGESTLDVYERVVKRQAEELRQLKVDKE